MRIRRFFAGVLGLGFVLTAATATANNDFIPNYYHNRLAINRFTAIAWSDRKEAGLDLDLEKYRYESGLGSAYDKNSQTLIPHVFYKTGNLGLEYEGRLISEKQTGPSSDTERKDLHTHIGLGYVISDYAVSVAGYDRNFKESSGGVDTYTKNQGAMVGLGKRWGDIYAGVGLHHDYWRRGDTGGATMSQNDWYLGLGKVYGSRSGSGESTTGVEGHAAEPKAATEAVLHYVRDDQTQFFHTIIRGLINKEERQYYGAIESLLFKFGGGSSAGWIFRGGVDYPFGDFYVGPELNWSTSENYDGSGSRDGGLNASIEAGYRKAALQLYARGGSDYTKSEATTGPGSESKKSTVTFGGAYLF